MSGFHKTDMKERTGGPEQKFSRSFMQQFIRKTEKITSVITFVCCLLLSTDA